MYLPQLYGFWGPVNTLLEPEVNDNLKILWGFICVLGQQEGDLFHSFFLSVNPALMEEKGTEGVLEWGIEAILLFYFLLYHSSFKLGCLTFISLDDFTDEKLKAQRH